MLDSVEITLNMQEFAAGGDLLCCTLREKKSMTLQTSNELKKEKVMRELDEEDLN